MMDSGSPACDDELHYYCVEWHDNKHVADAPKRWFCTRFGAEAYAAKMSKAFSCVWISGWVECKNRNGKWVEDWAYYRVSPETEYNIEPGCGYRCNNRFEYVEIRHIPSAQGE